jgi:hypothetical protein
MPDTPPLRVNADMCCLEEAPWTAWRGVCTLPKGHKTRCRFVAAEFVEVKGLGEEGAAAACLSSSRLGPLRAATAPGFPKGAIRHSPPQPMCGTE